MQMAKAIPISELPVISRDGPEAGEVSYSAGAILLMDKSAGWSSFDVVKKVRGMIKVKKIGHAGTLDPAATGLLMLCTGRATKSIEQIQELEKEYVGTVRLGASTPSYDAETEIDVEAEWQHIKREQIESVLRAKFIGLIDQTVPPYSAVKVKGRRLYKSARKGEEVELKSREVHIREIEITYINMPDITLKIRCSKGTYIRSIAHDLGLALGSRGYLAGLRRTAIGPFSVNEALTVDELQKKLTA